MGWRVWMTAGLVVGALGAIPACTTYIHPETCDRGATACGGLHDARFCKYVAVSVEGADCASLGITPSRRFCVATTRCIGTNYAVKDRDCRVVQAEPVRDSSKDECAPDTPMFSTR